MGTVKNIRCVLLLIAVVELIGCSQTNSPSSPVTNPPPEPPEFGAIKYVQIRAIRILHNGYGKIDVPGNLTNWGCRLTDAQIKSCIGRLDSKWCPDRGAYGVDRDATTVFYDQCKVGLWWDGAIHNMTVNLKSGMATNTSVRRDRTDEMFASWELQEAQRQGLCTTGYEPGVSTQCRNISIPIFFTGHLLNYRIRNGAPVYDECWALTHSPQNVPYIDGVGYKVPFIVITDAGHDNPPDGNIYNPPRKPPGSPYWILEHELGHYFTRFPPLPGPSWCANLDDPHTQTLGNIMTPSQANGGELGLAFDSATAHWIHAQALYFNCPNTAVCDVYTNCSSY